MYGFIAFSSSYRPDYILIYAYTSYSFELCFGLLREIHYFIPRLKHMKFAFQHYNKSHKYMFLSTQYQ